MAITFVPATGSPTANMAALQAALNAAAPGDTLKLQSNVAGARGLFDGGLTLPNKAASALPITITSDAFAGNLPAVGTMITPDYAAYLPKFRVIVNNESAIKTCNPSAGVANGYILSCLEIEANAFAGGDLVTFGSNDVLLANKQDTIAKVPGFLTLERCYLHGLTATGQKRGVNLHCHDAVVRDNWIADCWSVGQDSQAVSGCNGTGGYLVTNNYLEGAGENFLMGGDDPRIPGLVPSGLVFTRNLCFKPLSWKGTTKAVKNLFELKNFRNAQISGNRFFNCWKNGQVGYAILFTPVNQDGSNPATAVQDIVFENNWIAHAPAGVNISSHDAQGVPLKVSALTQNITIRNNLFTDINQAWGGASDNYREIQIGNGSTANAWEGVKNLTVEHNTFITTSVLNANTYHYAWSSTAGYAVGQGYIYRNNLARHAFFGVNGDNASDGLLTLNSYTPGFTWGQNVLAGGTVSRYPPGTFCPTDAAFIGTFVDYYGYDGSTAAFTATVGPVAVSAPAGAVTVAPGPGTVQAAIAAHAAGTTYFLQAGTYQLVAPIEPKSGDTIIGQLGAILDGSTWVSSDGSIGAIRAHNVNVDNVTVRNLTIRNMPQKGIHAFADFSDGWTIANCTITNCASAGVLAPKTSVVRNCWLHHNPGGGYQAHHGDGTIFEDNEISFNGTEQKIVAAAGVIFRRNWVHHNLTNGIWFDTNNTLAIVEDNLVDDNAQIGIDIEISSTATIRRNVVRRNGDTGIFISTSKGNTIYRNILASNFRGIQYFLNCASVGGGGIHSYDLANNDAYENLIIVGTAAGAWANALSNINTCSAAFLVPYLDGSKSNLFRANEYAVPTSTGQYWTWGSGVRKTWTEWQALPQDATSVRVLGTAGTGDYRVVSSSPYHLAGTDGADIGADMAAIAAAWAGTSTPPPPPPPATYTVAPLAVSAPAGGVSGTLAVTTQPTSSWTAFSNVSWITVTSGATGTGSGTVGYTVAANLVTAVRTGTLVCAGSTITVTQAAAPVIPPPVFTYTVAPTAIGIDDAGGTGTIAVTTQAGGPWTAVANVSWLHVTSGASGTGSGTVGYTIDANGGALRTGTFTIAGVTVTVTQQAVVPPPPACSYDVSPHTIAQNAQAAVRTLTVTTAGGCTWTAVANDSWLRVDVASGAGSGVSHLSIDANPSAVSARTGTVTIAGETVTVTQAAIVIPAPPAVPPPVITPAAIQPVIDPKVMLRWSDDGGHTWSDEVRASVGKVGQYGLRAVWRRLGTSRERTFQVVVSDPIKVVLIDAFVEVR